MVDDANFDRASFWVKTHGLQSRRMCKENVEVIGNTLGRVKHVEELNIDDCCWRHMRVRVNMDISQPLCRGRMVNEGGLNPHWVSS